MKYKLNKKIKLFLALSMCISMFVQSIPVYGTEAANMEIEETKDEPESGTIVMFMEEGSGNITASAKGYDDVSADGTGEKKEVEYPAGTEVTITVEASEGYEISRVQIGNEKISEFSDPAKYLKKIEVKEGKMIVNAFCSELSTELISSTPKVQTDSVPALLSDTIDSEEGDVDEEEELEEEGEDLPEGEIEYGTGTGTVKYSIGKNGTVTVDGTKLSSSTSISYDAGTEVSMSVKADSGYEIDEIYILDGNGDYLEYVVGFDSSGSHQMTFRVYGGITQTVGVTFTEEETEDPFEGAEGTVKFKSTTDTSLSRIDGGRIYRGENGELAYCGNAHAHAPGTSGISMKLDKGSTYQHAYDYIMYYGYPKHTTIYGTKYSKKDAHDITQWAIWLILDPNYYRGTFAANPTLAAVAKKLAAAAREYKGGNDKIDGTCLIYYPSSTKKQPMIILNESQPSTGKLKLKKSSSNPDITDGNSYYTLKGAEYVIYSDSACTKKVDALETKADGSTSTLELKAGTYYVKEATASPGYTVSSTKSKITIKTATTTTLKVLENPGKAYLSLQKKSSNANITDDNRCYSLGGAVYSVYTDESCTKQAKDVNGNAASFTTNDNGSAPELEMYLGDYWIKETRPATGYALDDKIYEVNIQEKDKHYKVNGKSVSEVPQSGYLDILLEKVDKETGKAVPQGSATLKDAEFTVKYYDGQYSLSEAEKHEPKRIWKFRTDADGKVYFTDDPEYFAGGDSFYYDAEGNPMIPLGTVTITETKEPDGYLIDETVRGIWIQSDGYKETASVNNCAVGENAFSEQIRRLNLQLMKYAENKDDDTSGIREPLDGVEFTITSETTGESWKIVTDEDGVADTKQLNISDRGNLVYDIYTVKETFNPYERYDSIEPMHLTLEPSALEDGKIYYYGIVNMEIYTPIQVVKVDSSTGETIPYANTEFEILDEDKNVMELTVSHYPQKETANSFVTDETGSFTFPELFDYGTYYLREVHAPYGYVRNTELLEITVDELHDWVEPLVIEFPNDNEMGQVKLKKIDSETENKIAGAEFTVTAAEDIITPDGTLRVAKGEVADVFTTDQDGIGISKELFLGKYHVQETKQVSGYVLDKTVYGIELSYQDEETPVVTVNLGEIKNKPTTIILNKQRTGTDIMLEGVGFEIWNALADEEDIDPDMLMRKIYLTDENGQIVLQYLMPGTYHLQEVSSLPGYIKDDTIYTFTVDENGCAEGVEAYEFTVENDFTGIIGTTARDPLTGSGVGISREKATIIDTVSFENLIPGNTYRIKGTLMDKETGNALEIDGEPVVAETEFTAEEANGTVDITFELNAENLKGKSIVVFEKAYLIQINREENDDDLISEEIEIAGHEDLEDESQTITYLDPKLHTTALNDADGTHTARADKITIVDKVEYTGLAVGGKYTVCGILMDKLAEAPVVVNGSAVAAETTFTAEKENGTVYVIFTFDASGLDGKDLVAFESMYICDTDILVAEHKDIHDDDQTVRIEKVKETLPEEDDNTKKPDNAKSQKSKANSVKTGDTTEIWLYLTLLALAGASGGIFCRNKMKKVLTELMK